MSDLEDRDTLDNPSRINYSRPSLAQVKAMVAFMEKHPEFANKKQSGQSKYKTFWVELSNAVNVLEGSVKSTKGWVKKKPVKQEPCNGDDNSFEVEDDLFIKGEDTSEALAVDRLVGSFETISASTHDIRNAILGIDYTLKRCHPNTTRLNSTLFS
ncbi:Uncharacterized protein OBRU01_03344 [Operophtera brumata]|uniref:Regulatory protein zeste n=1 Tax=Operophtera brumata TaxID=104452 RepID=A0A0L7LQQ9_OPEBR|nr:Uncharacterized protein OBRU01_03344 [Operophtera brumata]